MNFELLADRVDAIPIVARWYFEEWGHGVAENSLERTCARIQGKLNRDKPPLHVLAIEDEVILGVAQLKFREMDVYPDKEHWLGGVYVAHPFRGRGIASLLTRKIEEIARTFEIMTLYAQSERLDGGLYAQLDWKPVERVRYHGVDVVVLQRELSEPDEQD